MTIAEKKHAIELQEYAYKLGVQAGLQQALYAAWSTAPNEIAAVILKMKQEANK